MHVTIERGALADAVAWAGRALPARPAQAVLGGLLLSATGDTLAVSAFDYETSAAASAAVHVRESGSVLVPGRVLADVVPTLPAHPVELSLTGSVVTLTCGRSRFTVPTMRVEDYPNLPAMPEASGTVDADLFAEAVRQVAPAVSKEPQPPELTGVHIEASADGLILVATDRYRIAYRRLPWSGADGTALVPAKTLLDVAKGVRGPTVTIGLGDGVIGLSGGTTQTTARLLGGEFPAWRRLFGKPGTEVAEFDTGEMVDVLKRVGSANSASKRVWLTFTALGVTVESHKQEGPSGVEEVDADWQSDLSELRVSYSAAWLREGLLAHGADRTTMYLPTTGRPPALIVPKGQASDDEDGFRYLVMPVVGA